jgi:hypothetical protein
MTIKAFYINHEFNHLLSIYKKSHITFKAMLRIKDLVCQTVGGITGQWLNFLQRR